jgi:hypothetical protein
MSTLDSPAVAGLLAQLFAQADRDDPAAFQRANTALKRLGHPPDQCQAGPEDDDRAHDLAPGDVGHADDREVGQRGVGGQCLLDLAWGDALTAGADHIAGPPDDREVEGLVLGVAPVDDRCGGVFDNIEDVIPRAERDEFMLRYKTAAGFAAEKLNAAASIIPAGAKVR